MHWSIKTITPKESQAVINCDSAIWRNKPQGIDDQIKRLKDQDDKG